MKKFRADVVFPLLAPLGIILFFLYLQSQTGDFFVYFKAQQKWGHSLANPLASVAYTMGSGKNFTTILELATALVFVSLGIISLYRVNLSMGLFSLLIVLFGMSASNLNGLPRYALPAFAVFIAAGGILKHPAARTVVTVLLVASQLYCMNLFITWRLSF